MAKTEKKKLDLKIFPALLPSAVGASVAFLVLGSQISLLITSLVAGYFAFLIASILIEVISRLKHRRKS